MSANNNKLIQDLPNHPFIFSRALPSTVKINEKFGKPILFYINFQDPVINISILQTRLKFEPNYIVFWSFSHVDNSSADPRIILFCFKQGKQDVFPLLNLKIFENLSL